MSLADALAQADRQPVTIRCAHCPWTFDGPLADGRVLHADHRRDAHGIVVQTRKRRGRSPWSSNQPLSENVQKARAQGAARWASGETA